MEHKVLALGNYNSKAYRSISRALPIIGNIYFRNEHKFKGIGAIFDYYFENGFNLILMPNPYGNPRRMALYFAAKDYNIPIIVFDRGGLPNSWFFDSGFNADSETYSPNNWDKKLSEEQHDKVKSYISNFEHYKCLEDQGSFIEPEQMRENLNIPKDKKIIFVPFQRPSDTVIKYFSGNARSFHHFINEIENLQRTLEYKESNWYVICKKHPLEVTKPESNLRFVPEDTNINCLLRLSDMVVCINSGVGLLASIYEVPVYHYGSIYYSHPRINKTVSNYYEIVYDLENNILLEVCKETRDRLIHYLTEKVYSFGNSVSKLNQSNDGSNIRVTESIDFSTLRIPNNNKKLIQKKCLYITPVIPDKNNRGSVARTSQTLSEFLNANVAVDLLVLNRSERNVTSKNIAKRLKQKFPNLKRIDVRRHPSFLKESKKFNQKCIYLLYKLSIFLDLIRLRHLKIQNGNEFPSIFSKLVEKYLTQETKYDFIFVNYAKVTPKSIDNVKALKIIDTHDVQTMRMNNEIFQNRNSIFSSMAKSLFFRSEQKILDKYDKVISISEIEENIFKKEMKLGEKVETLNMSMNISLPYCENYEKYSYDKILFVGSNSISNVLSLEWFLTEVWEIIQKKKNSARLSIVGRVGINKKIKEVIEKKSLTGISSTTFIADLSKEYRQALIVIAPIIQGTGMKVKVVEALGHAKAIVGTSIAFEGINLTSQKNGIIADDAISFANAVLSLLENKEAIDSISTEARNLFEKNHSREYSTHTFLKIIEK